MSAPFIFQEYSITQYMFCHPENVKLRRGDRQLMRWQHLIDTAELKLIFKITTVNQTLSSIILSSNIRSLEVLAPLAKLITRGLQVRVLGTWFSFKWTTGRGNTQFQVSADNLANSDRILATLRSNGVPVIISASQPQRCLASLEPSVASKMVMANNASQFPSLETQIEEEETLFVPDEMSQRWEPTQVEDDMGLPNLSSELSLDQNRVPNSSTGDEKTAADGGTSLTPSEIAQLINRDQTINLEVDTFSEARASLTTTEKLLWRTAGLTSGLVLSLVTKNENGQCAIMLSRGCDVLHNFAFNSQNLRVYGSANVLVLCYTVRATHTKHMLQLDFPPKEFALVEGWLQHWNVRIESPMAAVPHTESTALLSSMRPASGLSVHHSEHRFWANRIRPSSAASKDSRSSWGKRRQVSRGSIHTNLGGYMRF